jgi:diguanylate cyclase (GGDEF)-like protein/PAS domain S-box-containing protein
LTTAPAIPTRSRRAVTEQVFRRIIEALPGVTYVSTAGPTEQIVFVSPQVKALLGIEPEAWQRNPQLLLDFIYEEDLGRVLHQQVNTRAMGEPFRAEYRLVTTRGEVIWVEHSTRPLALPGSDPLWMGTLREITLRKAVENDLRSLAYLDELTGLYNRRGFLQVAEQQLRLTQRGGRGAVVLYLDIGSLRLINDSLGYHTGDRVLKEVTALLRGSFRDTDIIARTGDDEFAVWAVETDGDRGEELRLRLLRALREFNEDHEREYFLQLSIGHTFCEPTEQVTVLTLLQRADAEMYRHRRSETAR